MSLADYQPEGRIIKAGKVSFTVEAISLPSLATLIRVHLPDLEAIYDLFQKGKSLTQSDFEMIVTAIVTQFPGLAANIIAVASNEPDATKQAAKLPAPVQLEALFAVGELTFIEVGSVKKCVEMVTTLLKQMKTAKPELAKTLTPKKKAR